VNYFLSPEPQADPQAVDFAWGLSPDPQAVPQALAGWLV
jgi:hypothetical protein